MTCKVLQLFIFPFAGGNSDSFSKLKACLDNQIEVVTVEYSGRGMRSKEPLADSFWELKEDALRFCLSRRNEKLPFAVMGYSMGCVVAYELLSQNKIPGNLRHLFLCAEVYPGDQSLKYRQLDELTDESVLGRAIELGGIDKRLLGNKRFGDIYIKPMISDFKHFFSYQFTDHGNIIKSDATCFYCEEDTPYEDVKKWNYLISGDIDFYRYDGNHFFVNDHYAEMAIVINNHLLRNEGAEINK